MDRTFAALNSQLAFLQSDNLRLNNLLRELIHENRLRRSDASTRESFDWQWSHLPGGAAMPLNRAFLDTMPQQIAQFCDLPASWFRGQRVIDVGCGLGRWSHGLGTLGAYVTSFDQSEAGIAATRALCQQFPKHEAIVGDLLVKEQLPTTRYDLVFCFGVCHHTADMIQALEHVLSLVRSGGRVFLMLYGYPLGPNDYRYYATMADWRNKLAPMAYQERVEAITAAFPGEDAHGYFDAISPAINELVTWEWVQSFMQAKGFTDVRRTITHQNHHFIATKQ